MEIQSLVSGPSAPAAGTLLEGQGRPAANGPAQAGADRPAPAGGSAPDDGSADGSAPADGSGDVGARARLIVYGSAGRIVANPEPAAISILA